MRISILLFAVLIVIPFSGLVAQPEQEFDRLMTRKRISCLDIEENSRYLIPKFHTEAKLDSIRSLLQYWERNCGETEVITRMELILGAEDGTIAEYPFTKTSVWNMLSFKRKTEYAVKYPEAKEYTTGNIFWRNQERINDQFDLFSSVYAAEVNARTDSPFAHQIMNFYSGRIDSLFPVLNDRKAGNQLLQSCYDSIVTAIRSDYVAYISITSGVSIPNGKATVLGVHPELGLVVGGMKQEWSAEFMFSFKFLHTSEFYAVQKNRVPTMTDYYLGMYFGGHLGYDVVRDHWYDLTVLAGIGYEGFNAIAASGPYTNDNVAVHSLNVNAGFGGRYYLDEFRNSFLSAELRYNALNYMNHGGSDLSGDAWSFRVGYSISPTWQFMLLRELGAY